MTPAELKACREDFEKACSENLMSTQRHGNGYANSRTEAAWWGFGIAMNTRATSDEVARDAARYRWLRNAYDGSVETAILERDRGDVFVKTAEKLDEAIDAAMAEAAEGGV